MKNQIILFSPCVTVLIMCLYSFDSGAVNNPPALTGIVTSEAEGSMEGVLISARQFGSIVTTTVVSDENGRYAFPSDRVRAGKYRISIRAVGYDLKDPGIVDIVNKESKKLDLILEKTGDLASQLSNTEWLMSIPGPEDQKMKLAQCVHCHSLEVVVKSRYDAEGFKSVLDRMRNYSIESKRVEVADKIISYTTKNPDKIKEDASTYLVAGGKEFRKYLASINLSKSNNGTWPYELKTLPRPRGRETDVIITQYDLPNPVWQPHDAIVDPDGMIWTADFARPRMGKLDPDTAGFTEWSLPVGKPGLPEGSLDIELDTKGNLWIARMFQVGIARFDKATHEVTSWTVPENLLAGGVNVRLGMLAVLDGDKVWTQSGQNEKSYELKPDTGEWSIVTDLPEEMFWYGLQADPVNKNRIYTFSLGQGAVGQLDLHKKNKEIDVFYTPTRFSGSRRGAVDDNGRAWFAAYNKDKIGVFSPDNKKIREWSISEQPYAFPYDVVPDKDGNAWAGGMHSDFVYQLDPSSGKVIKYLLPDISTNIRKIDVDNNRKPVTVWIGQNHYGKLLKLEPLQ